MKLYENIVIGNFLYAIGFALGKRTRSDAILPAINLLQQTPDDKRLADVFMASKSAILIVEFKRKQNTDSKEELKLKSLERVVRHKARIRRVSETVHWFIESSVPGEHLVTKIRPYLYAFDKETDDIGFSDFLELTAENLLHGPPSISDGEMLAYLDILALCNGAEKRIRKKQDGNASQGGGRMVSPTAPQSSSLILQVQGDGRLRYAHVASYKDLSLRRRELFYNLEREMELDHLQRMERYSANERHIELGRSPGRRNEHVMEMDP